MTAETTDGTDVTDAHPDTDGGESDGPPTERALRTDILREAGINERRDTRFTKDALNSIHAYLTGQFCVRPKALRDTGHQDYATRREMLFAVVMEAGVGAPQDRWGVHSTEYPAKFTHEELQHLHERMREMTDQRDWTPE
jgi:hypothetical protein